MLNDIDVGIEVRWGPITPSLLELARLHACDLILLCRKQRNGLTCALPGSVAERITMHAPVPVCLVHENGPRPIFSSINEKDEQQAVHALMGVDNVDQTSTVMKHAISFIAGLTGMPQPTIHMVRVISPFTADSDASMQEALDSAKKYQSACANETSMEDISTAAMRYSVVVGTDYSQTLIKEAENGTQEENTEMPAPFHILAISSLFGQQQHILLTDNNIVERITHETLLPVLVVPPQQG